MSIKENIAEYDVCNLNHIYNEHYEYPLPKEEMEVFCSGKAFDHFEFYNSQELERLYSDINEIYRSIMETNPLRENIAVISAGATGAGKTIKLTQDLEDSRLKGKNYAYVCPDVVCLKNQKRTYLTDLENSDKSMLAKQVIYDKWRPGSIAAAHLILANLIREKCAFYFGTTSTSPVTAKLFSFLKKQGYKIRLIHVTASEEVRRASVEERNKVFVQATEQLIVEKGLLLPQRIEDTFFKYSDEIEFYYRGQAKEEAVLVARWFKNEEKSGYTGTLQIFNQEQYEKVKAVHNSVIEFLKKPELAWKEVVESKCLFTPQ